MKKDGSTDVLEIELRVGALDDDGDFVEDDSAVARFDGVWPDKALIEHAARRFFENLTERKAAREAALIAKPAEGQELMPGMVPMGVREGELEAAEAAKAREDEPEQKPELMTHELKPRLNLGDTAEFALLEGGPWRRGELVKFDPGDPHLPYQVKMLEPMHLPSGSVYRAGTHHWLPFARNVEKSGSTLLQEPVLVNPERRVGVYDNPTEAPVTEDSFPQGSEPGNEGGEHEAGGEAQGSGLAQGAGGADRDPTDQTEAPDSVEGGEDVIPESGPTPF